eukprot:m.69566 g.69566  ORF g.69566 m.69566 type:complete len:490 (-) comp14258_c0_seq1:238-1707(-)
MGSRLGGSLRLLNWKWCAAGTLFYCWASNKAATSWRQSLEREVICDEAKVLGHRLIRSRGHIRSLTVIVNPVAGRRDSEDIFQKEVAPVLQLAGVDYTHVMLHSRRRESQKRTKSGALKGGIMDDIVNDLDLTKTDGIVIVGGDGVLSELVTCLRNRPEKELVEKIPIGIIPTGTTNTLASKFHLAKSTSQASTAGRAALAIARGRTKRVDAIAITDLTTGRTHYAMGTLGWGAAGALALRSQDRRWPGAKRYDLASIITLLRDWPAECKGELKVGPPPAAAPPPSADAALSPSTATSTTATTTTTTAAAAQPSMAIDSSLVLFSLHANLGLGRPLAASAPPAGSGLLMQLRKGLSRSEMLQIGLKMKEGVALSSMPECSSQSLSEFVLEPSEEMKASKTAVFSVDGEPLVFNRSEVRLHGVDYSQPPEVVSAQAKKEAVDPDMAPRPLHVRVEPQAVAVFVDASLADPRPVPTAAAAPLRRRWLNIFG